jgi:hypothetical protein
VYRSDDDDEYEDDADVAQVSSVSRAASPEDNRYYGEQSLERLEQVIRADKKNIAGWLNYAFVVLLLLCPSHAENRANRLRSNT